jgi:hypothetical protein
MPLHDQSDYARLTLSDYVGVETTTGDDVQVMTISREMTSLSCSSPPPESLTGEIILNSTCAKYLCADLEGKANSLCVKQLDECSLETLPSDADPRYFYMTHSKVDCCIRFQSTTNKLHYLAFNGLQLHLKHTTDDGDEETHFQRFDNFMIDSNSDTQLPHELQQQQFTLKSNNQAVGMLTVVGVCQAKLVFRRRSRQMMTH